MKTHHKPIDVYKNQVSSVQNYFIKYSEYLKKYDTENLNFSNVFMLSVTRWWATWILIPENYVGSRISNILLWQLVADEKFRISTSSSSWPHNFKWYPGCAWKYSSVCIIEIFLSHICKRLIKILELLHFSHSLQHQNSNSKKVILRNVTLKSTGTYRCEISAEQPDFKTVQGEGLLTVVCK